MSNAEHESDFAPLDALLDDPSVEAIVVKAPDRVLARRVFESAVAVDASFRD